MESAEMLIWWSSARNEVCPFSSFPGSTGSFKDWVADMHCVQSIPQTRHHFQNVVLGIEEFEKDVVWREEWEVEGMGTVRGGGSPRSAKGKEREKRRVSSGLGA